VTGLRFDRNYVPVGGGVLNVKADGVAEISTMIVIDPLGITINGDLEVVGTTQIDQDLIVLGALDVSGNTTLGDLSVNGTLDVSGATTLGDLAVQGTLDVSGLTVLNDLIVVGTFDVSGTPTFTNLYLEGTLGVSGETTLNNTSLQGTLDVSGATTLNNTTVRGTLDVSGATTLNNTTVRGTLDVSGATTLNNTTVRGTLDVSGAATLGDVTVTGTLDVSGAATLHDILSVDGKTILNSTLYVADDTALNNVAVQGALDVSGDTTLTGLFIQNPDGSYPADGSVPAITGLSGEVAWTPVNIDGASNLTVPLANFQVTGDGNLTGSAQAEYITLPDLNILNRHETYLWAQGDDILWQNGGTQPNISLTDWMRLLAPNPVSVVRPSGPTDTVNMQNATYALITTLLDRGILLTAAASPPTLRFNSSTNIRFTTFLTADPTDVSKRKTVTYPVVVSTPAMNALCSSVSSALSGASVKATMEYDTVQQLVRILVNSGYSLTINDVGAYGESTRFMNHLGIGESQILPSYETDVPNYSFTITGPSFLALTPNNDVPLAAPVLAAGAVTSFTYTFTITAPSTAGLTGDNLLQYYGIFLGGVKNNIIDATNGSWTLTGLTPVTTYTVAVSAIDKYNESPQASLTFTTPAVVIPWPPAGYTLGIRRNGVGGAPPVNDILVTPIRVSPALNNTYSFSIIPKTTLTGICLRISVDDGCVIRFTGLQPGGAPPNPFVNIPGPQPGATFGGIYQFSQPINMTANTVYDVSITYYNNRSTSAEFYLAYVQPTVEIPWSSNPNYACPQLNALLGQNLFAICCYN
jgi:cytoskeletal protein CcmA (bactofilin family)